MILTGRQRTWATPGCNKKGQRESWLLKTYGITLTEYNLILEFQGGVCAICGRKPKIKADGSEETFHVDHEHTNGPTGLLRGICCAYCNTRLIGRLKSHKLAQAMADYLLNPPAVQALGRQVIAAGRVRKRKYRKKRA